MSQHTTRTTLTGRVSSPPSELLRREVLEPQFDYEAQHLLPHYVQVEKALLSEYLRLGLLAGPDIEQIAGVLDEVAAEGVTADPELNLSDIALAVERRVSQGLDVPLWHVDRSRNDLQASTQLMFGRAQTLLVLADLLSAAGAARELAGRYTTDIMPGYTHLQAAQVITPGFHISAISADLLDSCRRLLRTYDDFNRCPLGGGALAGQELAWDRERLAELLGFTGPYPHALLAVASRSWMLELASQCSNLAVGLSRPVTDLMTWAGSQHGFIELPDELSGTSSAMPQKKNYPILERIRGRTAHVTSWYLDVVLTQRNTALSNSVEVSKEGSAQLLGALGSLRSTLGLLTEALHRMVFRTERLRQSCLAEYLGGFSLANRLALEHAIPWRDAQVIAGRYVVAALAAGLAADAGHSALLVEVAAQHGYPLTGAERILRDCLDPQAELLRRRSTGSAHPEQVRAMLVAQAAEHAELAEQLAARNSVLASVPSRIDESLRVPQHSSSDRRL